MMLMARQRSRSAAFAKAGREFTIRRSQNPQSPRWPAALPCSLSGMGEEAATPGQPVRAYARFRNVPRQFTLENYRLPLALPQSSGKFRKAHVCCTHSVTDCFAGQLEILVSLCRNCGRCDFLVETRGKPARKLQPIGTVPPKISII